MNYRLWVFVHILVFAFLLRVCPVYCLDKMKANAFSSTDETSSKYQVNQIMIAPAFASQIWRHTHNKARAMLNQERSAESMNLLIQAIKEMNGVSIDGNDEQMLKLFGPDNMTCFMLAVVNGNAGSDIWKRNEQFLYYAFNQAEKKFGAYSVASCLALQSIASLYDHQGNPDSQRIAKKLQIKQRTDAIVPYLRKDRRKMNLMTKMSFEGAAQIMPLLTAKIREATAELKSQIQSKH